MSRPPIREVILSDPRLSLHLCHRNGEHPEGFWLYDSDAAGGMNLSMGAPSEVEAMVEAVQYWKGRAIKSEAEHRTLATRVCAFITAVDPREEVQP